MADGEKVGGDVLGAASPFLNFIPYVGPLLSAGAAAASGFLEKDAAKKQAAQAAALRTQSGQLQTEQLNPYLKSKLTADQFAAQGDMPGLQMAKDTLANNMAAHLRAIRESSPNGANAVNAISLALGQQNEAGNKLGIQNAAYKSGLQETARGDLWDLGLQQRGLELYRNNERDKILGQANNLEAAATANKQTGFNTILGAAGSTAANITKNLLDPNYQKLVQQQNMNSLYGNTLSAGNNYRLPGANAGGGDFQKIPLDYSQGSLPAPIQDYDYGASGYIGQTGF